MSNLPVKPEEINWDNLEKLDLPAKAKQAKRNQMLNCIPPPKWLKKHPVYKNDYLPIDKVEYLLTAFFGNWYVEVISVNQIINSITVTVRIFYMDPDRGEYVHQDGVGACPMQVNSGANCTDLSALKPNAVMLALPIAKTNAIKDAADHIGRVFGRDLNRKDTLDYTKTMEGKFENAKITEK